MKVILKLDPTLNQLLKSFKRKIDNLIFRFFKKPYQNYIQKRIAKKNVNDIHKRFIKAFNLQPSRVIEIMYRTDIAAQRLTMKPKTVKMTDEEYKSFLSNEIKNGAISLNEMKKYIKASLFYDPDITDIHNESLEDNNGPSLKELVGRDLSTARTSLIKQEKSNSKKILV